MKVFYFWFKLSNIFEEYLIFLLNNFRKNCKLKMSKNLKLQINFNCTHVIIA